jgi:hypothetical protein
MSCQYLGLWTFFFRAFLDSRLSPGFFWVFLMYHCPEQWSRALVLLLRSPWALALGDCSSFAITM